MIFNPIQQNNIESLSNNVENHLNTLDYLYELGSDSILFQNYIDYQLMTHKIMQDLDNLVYDTFKNKKENPILDKEAIMRLSKLFKKVEYVD